MDKTKELRGSAEQVQTARKAGVIELTAWLGARFATVLSYAAVLMLLLMMLLTSFNVIVRALPGDFAIIGIYELTGYFGSAVAALSIAYTQTLGGHIAIDWVVTHFPARLQAAVRSVVLITSVALFSLLAWQSFRLAGDLWLNGEVSPTAKIPFFPFVYGLALGCVPVAIILFADFLKSVVKAVRQ